MCKAHIHNAISLVQNEDLKVVDIELGGLIEMLQHAAWRTDENVHPTQPVRLLLQTLSASDHTSRERVIPANLLQDLEDLCCELARGADDQGTEAVEFGPVGAVKLFDDGHKEGEGLAAASLSSAEDVLALQGMRDCLSLHIGEVLEVGLL